MTRTEDRLADALGASAAQVRDDRLRLLSEPGLEPGPRTTWRGWPGPAAAAVSVALVIGLALALTGGPRHHAGGPSAGRGGNTSTTTPRPKYFMQLVGTSQVGATVTIRSVTSPTVMTSAAAPHPAGWTLHPYAMAAAPDNRTFYIAYDATRSGPGGVTQVWIYRLGITDSRLARVAGGVLPSVTYFGVRGSMAVSPDGTKLALTVATPVRGYGPGSINEIVMVDLRTGARFTWKGGLDLVNHVLLIQDVSWAADGRSLVFFAVWCNPAAGLDLCQDAFGPASARAQQVRSVPVAARGGSLVRGAVLASPGTTGPVIVHAVAGPRPDELTLVLVSGRTTTVGFWPVATVERVAARTGAVLGIDYRLVAGRDSQPVNGIELGTDPSGQHLLLTYYEQDGFRTGQIGPGTFRPLPTPQPYRGYPITAW